jgi:hypothetical protein
MLSRLQAAFGLETQVGLVCCSCGQVLLVLHDHVACGACGCCGLLVRHGSAGANVLLTEQHLLLLNIISWEVCCGFVAGAHAYVFMYVCVCACGADRGCVPALIKCSIPAYYYFVL